MSRELCWLKAAQHTRADTIDTCACVRACTARRLLEVVLRLVPLARRLCEGAELQEGIALAVLVSQGPRQLQLPLGARLGRCEIDLAAHHAQVAASKALPSKRAHAYGVAQRLLVVGRSLLHLAQGLRASPGVV